MYAASLIETRDRPLGLRMRADLIIERRQFQGRSSWVVKDPVALRYFRLEHEAHSLLTMLDGTATAEGLLNRMRRLIAPRRFDTTRLRSLLHMLHSMGLLISDADGQEHVLLDRKRKTAQRKLLSRLTSIPAFRFPGIAPHGILNWLYACFWWVFRPWCVVLALTIVAAAGIQIALQFDDFVRRLPAVDQFFTGEAVICLLLAIGLTKILHELGHGLTCRHFGGECHEIGLMFLVFAPCLYCDTSDAWMLRNRWQRAAVAFAGIYVEIVIAACSVFIWWYTNPGSIHFTALSVVLICSVSTLLVNGNPFLRFDGYYVLSDLLGIPNLAERSRRMLTGFLRRVCLGLPVLETDVLPNRYRILFCTYAMASTVYRWIVVVLILWFLSKVFEPYGMQPVAHILIAMTIGGAIGMPLFRAVRFLKGPGVMDQISRPRLAATLSLLALIIACVCLIPIPERVYCEFEVAPRDAEWVFVEVPGRLDTVHIEPGQLVTTGEPLVTLTNPELLLEVERLESQLKRTETRLVSLNRRQNDPAAAALIPQTESSLTDIRQRLKERKADAARLAVRSSTAGTVLPPFDHVPESHDTVALPSWTGTPFDGENAGAWLHSGTTVGLVGDPQKWVANLIVDEGDIDLIKPGHPTELVLDEYPANSFQGRVSEIAQRQLDRNTTSGTGHQSSADSTQTTSRQLMTSYLARVPIESFNKQLLPGFRGRALITSSSRPAGIILWRSFLQVLTFR